MVLLARLPLASLPAYERVGGKSIWGPTSLSTRSSAFPIYEELGGYTFQMQLRCDSSAPTRPASPGDPADAAYRWPAGVGNAIADGRRHAINVGLVVNGAPPRADGGRAPVPLRSSEFVIQPDQAPDAFANFVMRDQQAQWLRAAALGKTERLGRRVRVSVRSGGGHRVQLRRDGRIVRVVRSARSTIVYLCSQKARPGRYTVRLLSPRGQTQDRVVRAR